MKKFWFQYENQIDALFENARVMCPFQITSSSKRVAYSEFLRARGYPGRSSQSSVRQWPFGGRPCSIRSHFSVGAIRARWRLIKKPNCPYTFYTNLSTENNPQLRSLFQVIILWNFFSRERWQITRIWFLQRDPGQKRTVLNSWKCSPMTLNCFAYFYHSRI